MGKFFEYPPPSGIAEGDERIVMEKNGVTYSPSISYILLSSLGDVDTTGVIDGSILKWSNLNEKWEIGADDGQIFDQTLNTGDNVQFGSVSVSTGYSIGGVSIFRTTDTTIALTSYTVTETDLGDRLVFTSGSPITVTLPQNSTEAIADGFQCVLRLDGAGSITVQVEGSDVLRSPNGATQITTQYAEAVVTKKTSGVWELNGEIA